MVAATSENIRQEYDILLNELKKYNPELLDKKRLLAISKCDLLPAKEQKAILKQLPPDVPYTLISPVTGMGILQLKDNIWTALHSEEIAQ
jgi:GTP-binding protein